MHSRVVVAMRLPDFGVGQQGAQPLRARDLSRMRPGLLDLRTERLRRSTQPFQARRTSDLRGLNGSLGGEERQDPQPGGGLGPVDERQSLLRQELDRLQTGS